MGRSAGGVERGIRMENTSFSHGKGCGDRRLRGVRSGTDKRWTALVAKTGGKEGEMQELGLAEESFNWIHDSCEEGDLQFRERWFVWSEFVFLLFSFSFSILVIFGLPLGR